MHSLSVDYHASISPAVTHSQCIFAVQGYLFVFLARNWKRTDTLLLPSPPVLSRPPISICQNWTQASRLNSNVTSSCLSVLCLNQSHLISGSHECCGIYILLIELICIYHNAPVRLLVNHRQGPYQIELLAYR